MTDTPVLPRDPAETDEAALTGDPLAEGLRATRRAAGDLDDADIAADDAGATALAETLGDAASKR